MINCVIKGRSAKVQRRFCLAVFGSPMHYTSATGTITSFMDRAFYTDRLSGRISFYLKAAAAIVSKANNQNK